VLRYFEFIGADEARGTANSAKFWQARVEGSTLYVTYGKIGSDGTTTVKEFPTPEAAEIAMNKAIAEKTRKGYIEVDVRAEPPQNEEPTSPELENFEALQHEQPAPKATLSQLSCGGCGQATDESDRFCSRCGAEIKLAPPSCGQCGFEVKDDARFCGNCGSALSSVEPQDGNRDVGGHTAEESQGAGGVETVKVIEQTDYLTRCEILGNFWISYKEDENFTEFVEYNDLGLPLAYVVAKNIVPSTAKAEQLINETWDIFLEHLGEEDTGFKLLSDLLGEVN
jgi:predicted DNA-binding WGR domain protein